MQSKSEKKLAHILGYQTGAVTVEWLGCAYGAGCRHAFFYASVGGNRGRATVARRIWWKFSFLCASHDRSPPPCHNGSSSSRALRPVVEFSNGRCAMQSRGRQEAAARDVEVWSGLPHSARCCTNSNPDLCSYFSFLLFVLSKNLAILSVVVPSRTSSSMWWIILDLYMYYCSWYYPD